jgi:exodeoxyribonuclease-3
VPIVLAGDFNVVPTERDMYRSKSSWKDDALVQPAPRAAYARLLALGFTDCLFRDYKRDGWNRGHGLRIDHVLLGSALSGRLLEAGVDREIRSRDGASDHAPMWAQLD